MMEKQTFDKCYYCGAKRVGKRAGKFEKFVDDAGFEHRMCHKCASQHPRDRGTKINNVIEVGSNCETKSPKKLDIQNPNIVTPEEYRERMNKDNTISPEGEKRSIPEPKEKKIYVSDEDKKRYAELKKDFKKYNDLYFELASDFIENIMNQIQEAIYHGEGKEIVERLIDEINLKSIMQKQLEKQLELNCFIDCLFEDIPF